jgi:peptide/nickel transport system permease protein
MTRFLLRRVALMAPVALGIIFFCFLGLELARNSSRQGSATLLRAIPLAGERTVAYLEQAVRGDLGTTFRGQGRNRTAVPVATVLAQTYVNSMGLLFLALLIGGGLGVGTGLVAALHEHSPLALGTMLLTLLGISTPTFFAALLLQVAEIAFYNATGVRLVPVGGFGWDTHLVLPVLVLAARPLAQVARVTLVSLREVLEEDYVRTAIAKGLPNPILWGRHALRNAAVPILTGLGISLRFALGSLPVVEYFFSWPGMGATLLSGIQQGDASLVVTLGLALGLTFMLINLALDVIYRLIDPRVGRRESAT